MNICAACGIFICRDDDEMPTEFNCDCGCTFCDKCADNIGRCTVCIYHIICGRCGITCVKCSKQTCAYCVINLLCGRCRMGV